MSELKSYDAYICENDMPIEDLPIVKDAVVRSASNKEEDDWSDYAQNFEVYKKSEADNVIAELENKIRLYEDLGSCMKGCPALRHNQRRVESEIYRVKLKEKEIAEKDKQLRHNKYKRCLAMARWCENENISLYSIVKNDLWNYTSNYWLRWRNKWLELAEKFKEVKS